MKGLLCRAIFLRHGQSDYTEVFPDLTTKGEETIRKSANEIKEKIEKEWSQWGYPYVRLLVSPKARALGSAAIIKEILGGCDEIKICPEVSAMEHRNIKKAKKIFSEYQNGKAAKNPIEIDYQVDPRFEDKNIFEPRSEIKKRFFAYLQSFIRRTKDLNSPQLFIHITHYEVLYHFVESVFENYADDGGTLSYGELLIVSLYDESMEVEFRNQKAKLALSTFSWLSL